MKRNNEPFASCDHFSSLEPFLLYEIAHRLYLVLAAEARCLNDDWSRVRPLLLRRDDETHPYALFALNPGTRKTLAMGAVWERFRMLRFMNSGRVYFPLPFYKHLLLPRHLFFQPREMARLVNAHSLCELVWAAPRLAVRAVLQSLQRHRRAAVLMVTEFGTELPVELIDVEDAVDYFEPAEYALLGKCGCAYCQENISTGFEKWLRVNRVADAFAAHCVMSVSQTLCLLPMCGTCGDWPVG